MKTRNKLKDETDDSINTSKGRIFQNKIGIISDFDEDEHRPSSQIDLLKNEEVKQHRWQPMAPDINSQRI